MTHAEFNEKALAATAEVSKAVLGKPEVVLKIMMAMLARGHVLIEDIPGVGKTTLHRRLPAPWT